jgi:two-component system, cell cycle response regulator
VATTVLLVEDNEVNRELLTRRLTQRGYVVLGADSGEAAVDTAIAKRPDVILMDLGLPGIDGWEATRRIKSNMLARSIPIIALSAHAMTADRDKSIEAGCVDFETKPVQLTKLIEKIDKYVAANAKLDLADSIFEGNLLSGHTPTGDTVILRTLPKSNPAPEIPRAIPVEDSTTSTKEHTTCPILRKNILVVEDNDVNREMLCRRLERQGYQTTEAVDGERALELCRKTRFDLVLLDIMMPGLDGYQVLKELKSDPELQSFPVIMISALDDMASVVRCIEAGAEDYLTKPYDPVLLRARINASLDKRRIRDQEMAYLKAVSDLTAAAVKVEKGEYSPDALVAVRNRADELGLLARVFEQMAREVVARENRLRQQVERLQVEVDEARKIEQVSAITETAYFQQLRRKVDALRTRSRRGSASEGNPEAPSNPTDPG